MPILPIAAQVAGLDHRHFQPRPESRLQGRSLDPQLAEARECGTLPLDLVQLDDGWQSQWGDWTVPHATRFPNGLKPLTLAIEAAGMMAGTVGWWGGPIEQREADGKWLACVLNRPTAASVEFNTPGKPRRRLSFCEFCSFCPWGL